MKTLKIKNINRIRLTSYSPLCLTLIGEHAINEHNLPGFIDGSCRREPDLQHTYPSITALCRRGMFAPRLNKHDIVVYITKKGMYKTKVTKERHHRMVAILQVIEKKKTHQEAAIWYNSKNFKLPSNCMVDGNNPEAFDRTAGNFKTVREARNYLKEPILQREKLGKERVEEWNSDYLSRSKDFGHFLITTPLFIKLDTPPVILTSDFEKIFGKVPGTQNPPIIQFDQLQELAKLADIELQK